MTSMTFIRPAWHRAFLCILGWAFPVHIVCSQVPVPAPPQSKSILLWGGVAHCGDGRVIENSAIGFRDGRLDLVADASLIRLRSGAYDTTIDLKGKHIYPGLIALNTIIGLNELNLVRATRDFRETGKLNPSVRVLTSYNTDSKIIPTVRVNGVLLAEVVPQGGTVSGLSSVMRLDGWNWEDAALAPDIGLHVHWPRMHVDRRAEQKEREKRQEKIREELAGLQTLFDDARAYSRDPSPAQRNLHLEAMRGLFDGSLKLFIHAQAARQITAAVHFCMRYGLQFVLVGGRDAWRLTDLLKEHKVAVVLDRTHGLPMRRDEDVDIAYRTPGLLRKAGVEFCTSVDGFWQVRNLSYNAGTGAAYGLTREEALESITLAPARILGIDSLVGSLEVGKHATLVVAEGDLLDMRTSTVERAYIEGRSIDLDNMQWQLYQKFRSKYGIE